MWLLLVWLVLVVIGIEVRMLVLSIWMWIVVPLFRLGLSALA
jgi:hypothetical protein